MNALRILQAHNFYGSSAPSGENLVFNAERALLQARGHEVFEFARHSDEIRAMGAWGALRAALSYPWNPFAAKAIQKVVDAKQPDVVHVHNTFPMLSPAIFHSVNHKAARVLTLHNYRLFCPAAIPMRSGKVCTECLDGHTVFPSMAHGCYRGNRLATLPLAVSVALHRNLGTWSNEVDAYITLSEFQREMMIKAGLPADLVHVKPNFYPGEPIVLNWNTRREAVVFAGRLTEEKGVLTLVEAWLAWGKAAPELRIIGDGDLSYKLNALAASAPEVPIRFLGQLSNAATQDEIASARLLVLPSEWFEGFPMVVREAFAFGTPAAVSNIGALPSIVWEGQNGVLFEPANSQSLLQVVKTVWESAGELARLATGARKSFETYYTEDVNYKLLINIYEQAMNVSLRRKGSSL